MTSPRALQQNIRAFASKVEAVRETLLAHANADAVAAQLSKECQRTADGLAKLLKSQQLPQSYKVAVVGRFKTGKSSFVNELLGARLAGEDTNPETAAITTFRHGADTQAIIRFLPKEKWDAIQQVFEESPEHIDAHRIRKWKSFDKPREEGNFDLVALEEEYLKSGGFQTTVVLAKEEKNPEAKFRRRLKEFTSGTKPHHCLVHGIDIAAPAPILDEGILLIDTPGLDDTERYRVSLTEQTADDADAILFLTKSGGSYGQSDKDFLLSLLRKGTVRQLIIVVTQIDITYQQYLDGVDEEDEDLQSMADWAEIERRRLVQELTATLTELGQEDSPAIRRYREQIGKIEIIFTSVKLHRDRKTKKPVSLGIALQEHDPGGIEHLRHRLLHLLSTESRLACIAQDMVSGARRALLDLGSVLEARRLAIRDIKDQENAAQKLQAFRDAFAQATDQFKIAVESEITSLRDTLQQRQRQHAMLIENIVLLAERELVAFEKEDVARYWRPRRFGNWGYMRDFQTRVANRIFPRVRELLDNHVVLFTDFTHIFEAHLNALLEDGARISHALALGTTLHFDITDTFKQLLEYTMDRAQSLIDSEELRVTWMLNNFVSDEVSDRIHDARDKVSHILGKGTQRRQSTEVQDFYREVERLLSKALCHYLIRCEQSFCEFLVKESKKALGDALAHIHNALEQAADNVLAATAALVENQREITDALVATIKAEMADVLSDTQKRMFVETNDNSVAPDRISHA